jgi:predicted metal-dependent peptidase
MGGIDMDEAESLMDQIIDGLLGRALRGDESARDALIDLGEQLGGEGGKFWSKYGIGLLQGKKIPPKKVEFWKIFLRDTLGSILMPSTRMQFPRKLIGAYPFYEAVNSGIPLMPMGKDRIPSIAVYTDTSGSVPEAAVRDAHALVGEVPDAEAKFYNFTTVVTENTADEIRYDRGGTDFGCIDEHVMAQDEMPDAIIIVTDGYAPAINPTWADRAIWLIAEGGDMWPLNYGMNTIEMDLPKAD